MKKIKEFFLSKVLVRSKVIICLTIATIFVLTIALLMAGCSGGGSSSFGAWSPDGNKIAFESGSVNNLDIWAMNADSSNQTNLTNKPGLYSKLAWSPNGSKIAYSLEEGNISDIWVMDADGNNQTNLTNKPGNYYDPVWSTNGNKIALNIKKSWDSDIWVMNADGSNLARLTGTK